MRVRIHHGAHEIGGNCVEVESVGGDRILLDLGRPLDAGPDDIVALPAVRGLTEPDGSLLGVIVTHPHLDHYGLVRDIATDVPVFIGREAAAVLEAAAFFCPLTTPVAATGYLRDRAPFVLGPFAITPYLMCHSGFDAYALLVEVDGKRLFYTGDFRGHGRKASVFRRLLADPPRDIDVLVCEGTSVRSDCAGDEDEFPTETDLEDSLVEIASGTAGAVVMFGSAQNLDRVVTAYRAACRAGRELVVDLYGATVAAATRPSIPQPGFDAYRVIVPQRQRVLVKESGEFDRVAHIRGCRVFAEDIAREPGRYLVHVPSSSGSELLRAGVLGPTSQGLWSMWNGYLAEPSGMALTLALRSAGVPFSSLHTSGHASVPDLKRLIAAMAPRSVVPIHTEAAGRFATLFPHVVCHDDRVWWAA